MTSVLLRRLHSLRRGGSRAKVSKLNERVLSVLLVKAQNRNFFVLSIISIYVGPTIIFESYACLCVSVHSDSTDLMATVKILLTVPSDNNYLTLVFVCALCQTVSD